MIEPLKPADEERRLQTLRELDILDTPDEERFDRITRRATQLLNLPIAYVSLIDANRQWLKSAVGPMPRECERKKSFCAHAILQSDPLVVPDAKQDPRFNDNPLVAGEPFLRFYAGVPITCPRGDTIGTFSVADHEPREFSREQLRILVDLAAQIAAKINQQPRIFISYSHLDEQWKDQLVSHLSVLQQQDHLQLWEDRQIGAGDAWRDQIQEAMESSNVAILLISANYLTSQFILSVEIPEVLRRRNREGIHIIPMVIKPCAWSKVKWLSAMNLYPKDGKPLSGVSEHEIDNCLAQLATLVCEKNTGSRRLCNPAPSDHGSDPSSSTSHAGREEGPPLTKIVLLVERLGEPASETEKLVFRRPSIVIGRSPHNEVTLPDPDCTVSSRHAEIKTSGHKVLLTDLASKNFTYVNGVRLPPNEPHELKPSDKIRIGDYEVTLERVDSPSATQQPFPTGTVFAKDYQNPFHDHARQLADLLHEIAQRFDAEAPSRRQDGLLEAIRAALGEHSDHPSHTIIAGLLSGDEVSGGSSANQD